MKSEDRCKEHFQGDKCRGLAGHDSPINMEPDPVHVGQFQAWDGSGDAKRKVATFVAKAPKRNRVVNRITRGGNAKEPNYMLTRMSANSKKTASAILAECAKYLRGGRG